jgi:hypothetical protein
MLRLRIVVVVVVGGGGVVVMTFMQGIYNIPETNHVPTVYSVASVLYLRFLLHVILFHV